MIEFSTLLETGDWRLETPLAIAVSGGADSMALLWMAHAYAPGRVTALTVDHGLRKESAGEAKQVGKWCGAHGIEHHILNVQDSEFRIRGKQQEARDARYALLTGWCKKNNVPCLLTGHHRGDQAETLFFRLARGSNLRGLACIQPVSEMHGIRIIRPLLGHSKKELMDYLQANDQPWIEDPSNRNMDYTRNAIRAQLQSLADTEHVQQRAADVAKFFGRMRALIDQKTEAAMKNAVTFEEETAAIDHKNYAALPPEIARELLARLIQNLTGNDHPPRTVKLERLGAWLAAPDKNPATLAHLVFKYDKKPGIIRIFPQTPA